MAKAKRPSLSSSSNPEELMKLLLEEEEAAPFNIGIEAIIQHHLQTLNKSYNRIQKLLQTSLIHSYKRLGRIHEVENDHVVFHDSSEALQKDIKSSIQVAQNITTIFKSILPRHTLDHVYNKIFFLVNFSKSEDLKVSKFQKKTVFVRNKTVDLAVKLYNLRTRTIRRSVAESIQYGLFRSKNNNKAGTLDNVVFIERLLFSLQNDDGSSNNIIRFQNDDGSSNDINPKYLPIKNWVLWKKWFSMKEEIIKERDERMMKIEEAMKELEGIIFGIYVMLQTQVAISAYVISERDNEKPRWVGTGHHQNIKKLADAETKKKKKKKTTTLSMRWFKSKIISFTDHIYYYYLH